MYTREQSNLCSDFGHTNVSKTFLAPRRKQRETTAMKMAQRNVTEFSDGDAAVNDPDQKMHTYEVHPRTDHHGVNLISDVLPFGRLLYLEVREAVA